MRCFSVLAAIIAALTTHPALAQSSTWVGPPAGSWHHAANWSPGVIPDGLSSTPLRHVQIDGGSLQDSQVSLYGTAVVGSLAINTGDQLCISPEVGLFVGSAEPTWTVDNAGRIVVGTSADRGLLFDGVMRNRASATVELEGGNLLANPAYSVPRISLLWNEGTVQGSGAIGNSFQAVSLLNEGLIHANVLGEALTITGRELPPDPFVAQSFHSGGTLRASQGGTLRLAQWEQLPLHNFSASAGSIEAWGDSIVEIEDAQVIGGRLVTSHAAGTNEGLIRLAGNVSLQDVESTGQVELANGSLLYDSVIHNRRTLSVPEGARVQMQGRVELQGPGTLSLSHAAQVSRGYRSVTDPLPQVVNATEHTIGVYGDATGEEVHAALGSLNMANAGTIEASGAGANLQVYLEEEAWTNSGIIQATQGGILSIYGEFAPINNTGGLITVDEHSRLYLDAAVTGGTIRSRPAYSMQGSGIALGDLLKDVRLEGYHAVSGASFSGRIENVGTIDAFASAINMSDSDATFVGGGEVYLDEVYGFYGTAGRLINEDNTLYFTHLAKVRNANVVNRGTIATSERRYFDNVVAFFYGEDVLVNSGLIRAIPGTDLALLGSVVRNYETIPGEGFVGGTIRAETDTSVSLIGAIGGRLHAEEGGVIYVGLLNSPSQPVEIQLIGRIESENAIIHGTLRNNGDYLVTGEAQARGVVRLLGSGELRIEGSLLPGTFSSLFNGPDHTISGFGTLGLARNEGVLDPGMPTDQSGLMMLSGSTELAATSQLLFSLGGLDFEQFDQLAIDSESILQLGGTLRVDLVDLGPGAPTPQVGDSWHIIEVFTGLNESASDRITGAFDTLDLPELDGGLTWQLEQHDLGLSLIVGKLFSADFNIDAQVDTADLTQWQADYGLNDTSDANDDGQSDGLDFLAWQQQAGSGLGIANNLAVPEPNAGLLLACGYLLVLARHRRSIDF